MTELPIVVEAHPWLDVGFGIIMLLVSYVLVRRTFDPSDGDDDVVSRLIFGLLVALFTFGLGLSLLVRHLNWQFRLEEKGIVLHAPFDYMHPSAEMGWSEITSVYVFESSYRGGASWKLRILGKPGTEIVVHTIDRLPAQFGRLLQTLVAERAPQAKDSGRIAEDFIYARRHPGFLANGYSVRNGRGERLR